MVLRCWLPGPGWRAAKKVRMWRKIRESGKTMKEDVYKSEFIQVRRRGKGLEDSQVYY